MIKEFSAHPKPQNNNAKIACIILAMVSAIGFIVCFQLEKYRGIVGVCALMVLTTGILIYTKYISPEFYYDITFDSDELPIFVVRQIVGKRQSTFCRIDLADIEKIEHETKEERRRHKTPKGVRKYIYAPTLFPKETYRMTVKGRYETAEIIIECSEEFAKLIREYSEEARKQRALDEE